MRKTSLGYPFLLKTVSTKPVTFAQRIVLSLIGIFLLTMQVSRGQYIETSKLYQATSSRYSDDNYAQQTVGNVVHIISNYKPTTPVGSYYYYTYKQLDATTGTLLLEKEITATYSNPDVLGFQVIGGEVHALMVASPSTSSTQLNAYYVKLDATTGNKLFEKTIGGTGADTSPKSLLVLGNNVTVFGATSASNFTTTDGTSAGLYGGAFAYTFNNSTGTVGLSTIFFNSTTNTPAGSVFDFKDVKTDGSNFYVVGVATESTLPITTGNSYSGSLSGDIFYIKLNASTGSRLVARYIGGTDLQYVIGYELSGNNLALVGSTSSTGFPTTDGSQTSTGAIQNYYHTQLDASNGNILISKVISSPTDDYVSAVAFDNNYMYILGQTSWTSFPVTNGSTFGGNTDMLYVKVSKATGNIVAASYIGGNGVWNSPGSIFVSGSYVYITGLTTSSNYPVTNQSVRKSITNGRTDIVATVLDNATTTIKYSTYLGGAGTTTNDYNQVELVNGKFVFTGPVKLLTYPTTATHSYLQTVPVANERLFFYTVINVCPTFTAPSPDNVSPSSQSICNGGFIQQLNGTPITAPVPTIYRNNIPESQYQPEVLYQWQQASSASGPWTNIAGATSANYIPPAISTTTYFRRIATADPLCGGAIISTSDVATINVSANVAPTVSGGGIFNTCPGSAVTIGGLPTATGGASPYNYSWTAGADPTVISTASTVSVSPNMNTTYTVKVIDNNGCVQAGQAIVNAYSAYAGSAISNCAGTGALLGGTPVAGVVGVTYGWSPTTNLSCTTCAQPLATPNSAITYTLTETIPITGGGTCNTTSSVSVRPIAAPTTANFAGSDVTICIGNTATLGTAPEVGFIYTWAPGNYLTSNNASTTTFQPGSLAMPTPNPITYYLTANNGTCMFVDSVKAYVIEARAWVDGCGPRTVGEPDRTPNINETYTWTKVSGPGSFTGPTNIATTTVSESIGGSTTYRLTTTLNGVSCTDDVIVPTCGCVVDVRVGAPFSCPSFGLNGGDVTLTAVGNTNNPTINNAGFSFTWSPTVGLSTYTGNVVKLTDNINRTYTVTMTSLVNPAYSCTRTIDVNNPAWSLPIFAPNDVSTCTGTPVTIGSASVAGYSYAWTPATGLSNATISNPMATVTTTTPYKVLVTDVGSGCTATKTVVVNVPSIIADAGPDIKMCNASGIVTIGTPAISGYTYSWAPSGSNWQGGTNQNSAQPQVLIGATTNFTLTVTNTATGCTLTDVVTVTLGTPVTAFTLPDIIYCPSTGAVALGSTAPVGMTTYAWSPSNLVSSATIRNPNTLNPAPSTQTVYTLKVTNASGCTYTATQTLNPNVVVPIAGNDRVICLGTSTTIGSASNLTGAGISYSWTPTTGLSSSTSSNPIFTPTTVGDYTFTVSKTEGTCVSNSTVRVSVVSATLSTLTSGTVCQGGCTTIGTSSQNGYTYLWSPTTGLSNATIPNPTACVSSTTSYTLTATNLNGCTVSASVVVGVNPTASPVITMSDITACVGSSSTKFNPSVSPTATYTYQWSPADGTISNLYVLNPTITVMSSGSKAYTLTVANTSNGCSTFKTSNIDASICSTPTPCTALSSASIVKNPTGNIATGATLNLTSSATGTNGTTAYAWAATTGGTFSSTTVASPTWSSNTGGTYNFTVTITNTDGVGACTTTATNSVSVLAPCTSFGILSATATPTSIGAVSAASLNVTGTGITGGTTTFSWAGTGGFVSTLQSPSTGTINTAGGYTYSVTATNADGTGICTASATASLTVTATCVAPTGITATITPSSVGAGGNNISLSSTSTGAINWLWSGPSAFSSTLQNPGTTTAPTIVGGYTYSVTASHSANATCTASVTASLTVTAICVAPTGVTATISPTTISTGGSISLSSTSSGATNWSWDNGSGFTSTLQNPGSISAPASVGTYIYTVTASNSANATCTATATATLSVSNIIVSPGCTMNATITQSACNNNGTPMSLPKTKADDYFDITVLATNGSSTGSFDIFLAGNVIGTGTYGTNVLLSGASGGFKADGATIYSLAIEDKTDNSCYTIKITTAVVNCSTACPPPLCPMIIGSKH